MTNNIKFKVLQLSAQDIAGGAERVALDLHRGYLQKNIDARLYVRHRRSAYNGVHEVDIYQGTSLWGQMLGLLEKKLLQNQLFKGRGTVREILAQIAMPSRWKARRSGLDDFNYPYTKHLTQHKWKPNVIQLHNIHGNYFGLEALPQLSNYIPVVWTLHDTWAMTGHCAYFIDCNRWLLGCGQCPDLNRAPSIPVDGTHENWLRKRRIYAKSKVHIVCPSHWLMKQVEHSILQPATKHVIPNGVDHKIFRSANRTSARQILGLPQDKFICLFVAVSGSTANPYKDYSTIDAAINQVLSKEYNQTIKFICLGGQAAFNQDPQNPKQYVGRINQPEQVALYYQAADVYLHAANADNFPCTILEAQACGLPVVATMVGGIPEQIEDGVTGYLVARGDSEEMAKQLELLIKNPELCKKMSDAAIVRSLRMFNLEQQIYNYLQLYAELQSDSTTLHTE